MLAQITTELVIETSAVVSVVTAGSDSTIVLANPGGTTSVTAAGLSPKEVLEKIGPFTTNNAITMRR